MATCADLIGRSRELAELERAVDSVRGGKGECVLLAGEAGAGKSRLAEEALSAGELIVLSGRGREGGTPSYGPLANALRAGRRLAPQVFQEPGPLLGYLGLLLPELGDSPQEAETDTLMEAISGILRSMARHAPLTVQIDDLQWADEASLESFPLLADRLRDDPVLLLGIYRNDEVPRGHPVRRLRNDLRRARRLWEIRVEPLDRPDCESLLHSLLGGNPSPALLALVHERTHGIPLYVEELAGVLVAGARLRKAPEGLELDSGQDIPIPDSLRDAVLLRIDGLSAPARRLLDVAAVAGTDFEPGLVAEIAGADVGLEELLERQLLVEHGPSRLRFRHALIREAVEGEVTWSRRRRWHREVATRLGARGGTAEEVAEHWLAAQAWSEARGALVESARKSCSVHAYRDAARASQRALEVWPDGEDEEGRIETLFGLARCAQVSGQLVEAGRALRELLASPRLARDPRRRADAQRSLGTVLALQGAWTQSVEAREAAARAFREASLPGEAAVELQAAAERLLFSLHLKAALDTATRAAELAEEAARFDLRARALSLAGYLTAMQGGHESGRQTAQAGLSLALEHGLPEAASYAYRRLAGTLELASDYRSAAEAYAGAIDFCDRQGLEDQRQLCRDCMAWVLFQSGDWQRAAATCREIVSRGDAPEGTRLTAGGLLGLIGALRGETRPARRRLADGLRYARQRELVSAELLFLWGVAVLEEHEGHVEAASRHYRQMLARWAQTEDKHDVIGPLCTAATLFADQGAEADAAACAEALASIASATGNQEALAGLAYALGEAALLRRNAEEARRHFEQAAGHFERLEMPFHRALTAFRAGVATRETDADAAARHLRDAFRLARRLGARPLAGRVARVLEQLGEPADERRTPAAPGRDAVSGLTGRQLEVARLIAQGLTNREIARRLFLSTRTVDMHVRHILDRLDCRSRSEAVRKASQLDLLG